MNINDRAAALADKIKKITEGRVHSGPFEGMLLPNISGNSAPFYLGTYEHELHSVILSIILRGYKKILNVGCGFGYYACGLAKMMPKSQIYAMDIADNALMACQQTVDINCLQNVQIGRAWVVGCDLIIMDCEGAEEDLLVRGMNYDILVESHECIKPGITQKLIDRYADTHNIDIIHNKPAFFNLQDIFHGTYVEHFDHAIATWEGRAGPTPWLMMTKKENQDV